ncbi:MAG: ABC transporter permease [Rhodocyclaceae bacterium]|jgi:peptide/nickel transport system permease protein|nr:ABC transporter permease [Rhodocyclaceae bacterium]MCE2979276.1 ABC transporter permease [Betaproteobacteria bacterium]MCA3073903.1 ABC transporter permease [Rhodocyclaceae bacterium]MCA3089274.1 ABC transporter permease [Rhodocyclaceae bacterium]MCA3092835.1 ABC transporter permease [Rhodocyclaceae bacterium]
MLNRLFAQVGQTALVLFFVSVASFVFLKLAPGDPVSLMLGSDYNKDSYDKLFTELGLDRPWAAQYASWLGSFVTGDWGRSFVSNEDIFRLAVMQALPVTLCLAAYALVLALLVGIPAGVLSALKRDTWMDLCATGVAVFGNAFPSFYLGIVLIWVFGVGLGWFPTLGFVAPWENLLEGLWYLTLPAITLAAWYIGLIARVTRASLLDVLGHNYILAARARGEGSARVVWVHAMRNVLMPLTTTIGLQLGGMLRGAVMTEVVFALPGLGMMITAATLNREYTVVQAGVMLSGLLFVVVNLVVDQLYTWLDPRLRRLA